MTKTDTILDEKQIAEIQAILDGDDFEAKYMAANVDNVAALCQTVRGLRAQLSEMEGRYLEQVETNTMVMVNAGDAIDGFRTRAVASLAAKPDTKTKNLG